MNVSFSVTFAPSQVEDYIHYITFNTDTEQYVLPLIALGPRPIFNFPDQVDAVTLFESKITCTPGCRFLPPGSKDTFVISFFNSNPGPFFEEINFFIRDTDVHLKVYLKGEVIYPSIKFSVSSLDFGDVSLALHWGQVKLLRRSQKTLTLCNDSPVVVHFKTSWLNRDSKWQIEPAEGVIEPESELDLIVSLYLVDAEIYTNKAVIHLENMKDIALDRLNYKSNLNNVTLKTDSAISNTSIISPYSGDEKFNKTNVSITSTARPNISEYDPKLGYLAIATLTHEYLDALNIMFNKRTSEHLNSPLTEICLEDPIFQQDWHICSPWDEYPSVMDIEMSIERVLVTDFLKLHPDVIAAHSATAKMRPISGFNTIPYVIDFGVVITGCTVWCKFNLK
ncbi:unnamed protein product, partial [Iphiclides podalirius]